jgi:ABC-type transport system substrate-binding protein
VRNTPGLSLKPVYPPAPFWVYFPDQWNPKSPWNKLKVRHAANLALDRDAMSKALFLGFCKTTNSIIPASFEYFWQPPAAAYDPAKARQLLAEAGYPSGFDGSLYYCDSSYSNIGEAAINNLAEIGIRLSLQPLERAGFIAGYSGKKFHNGVIQGEAARSGTRPPGWPRFSSRTAPTSMAAITRSTRCFQNRRANWTIKSEVRYWVTCKNLPTKRRSTRRSGSSPFSTLPGQGSANPGLASSKASPIPGRSKTSP